MTGNLETIIFSAVSGILVSGFGAMLFWKRTKAETGNFVVNQFRSLSEEQNKKIEQQGKEIQNIKTEEKERREKLEKTAEKLEERIELNNQKLREYEIANDNCEFEHGITRLQLNKALIKLEMTHWVKASVFVLDDSEMVIKTFEHRFQTIPVVHFKSFVNPVKCLLAAKAEKPEILVLDYSLSENYTAEDVIKDLGYEPEIFIMSGTKEYEVKFKDTNVRFYYKDAFFIRNITKAILEYLIYKNR